MLVCTVLHAHLHLFTQCCLYRLDHNTKHILEHCLILEEVKAEEVLAGGGVQQQLVHIPEEHLIHEPLTLRLSYMRDNRGLVQAGQDTTTFAKLEGLLLQSVCDIS